MTLRDQFPRTLGQAFALLCATTMVAQATSAAPRPRRPDPAPTGADSTVYRILPVSRLIVNTGKAGVLGFVGHNHKIQAREFSGVVVYNAGNPAASRVEIRIATRSLEVLTPDDTAEIRKVTAAMRKEVLRTEQHPEITLTSRSVTPTAGGFHLLAVLTLAGRTREIPIDVGAVVGPDTLRATTTFSVKQSDFGITPYRGGPGGTVAVADRVRFTIDIVAAREP